MGHWEFEIRQARPGDERLFSRVVADVFDHPVDPVGLAAHLAAPEHVLVMVLTGGGSGGEIVGQCACVVQRHPDGRPASLYVDNVGVAPPCQR